MMRVFQTTLWRSLLLLGLVAAAIPGHWPSVRATKVQSASAPRRVNIPHLAEEVDWAQSAIFWFGENQAYDQIPGRNYADVRVAYTSEALHVRLTVVDYYLWYNQDPGADDDLSQYDAVAVYLDTDFDRAGMPQSDDYFFLMGAHHDPRQDARYRRQARGTGSGWDTNWSGDWSDYGGFQWSSGSPNSNAGAIDYGWNGTFTIPWQTLGLSGPPSEGTLWGLGVQLYDRDDQPPAGYVAPQAWPEPFNATSPASWAELHFGYADYTPPAAVQQGSTTIRAASPTDNTVEDAYMGGGGWCAGGHNGGSEVNHGDDTSLYVGTETAPTHFPCFNKSYLRFSLDAVPADKTIISASLTLHLWGHAGETPDLAYPSWVHLFTISDPWEEMTIHWNNAPLAQENVAASWVYPYSSPGNIQWPGDPYTWDATQAVAEAYTAGDPLSIALYGADTDQHSSKYMTASETGDWNVAGRPKLTVVWGAPQAELDKRVWPVAVTTNDTVTYTLGWLGTGEAMSMADPLPTGLGTPGPINASSGSASYDPLTRRVTWEGTPAAGQAVTVTFATSVQASGPQALPNTATLTSGGELISSDTAVLLVDPIPLYLPFVRKN